MTAGFPEKMDEFKSFVEEIIGKKDLFFKESYSDHIPFNRMLVKCKQQLIPVDHKNVQPNQYDGRKPLSEWELTRAFDERSPFKPPVELAYPMLRERGAALRRDGINFHDLSDLFAETTETIYRDKCCHFNRRGRERLAEAIAEHIAADHRSQETVSAGH